MTAINKKIIPYLIALTLIFSSCTTKNKISSSNIKITISAPPISFDPSIVRNIKDISIIKHLFNCLSSTNETSQTVLNVAKSYEVSSDGLDYTFYLNKTYWSDGSEVTAEDFVRGWQHALSPTYEGIFSQLLFCIKNGSEARSGKVSYNDIGVQAIDKYTFKVSLVYPTPFFINLISHPVFAPRHSSPNFNPSQPIICNGFYSLKSFKGDYSIILEKHKYNISPSNNCPETIHLNVVDDPMTQYFMFEKSQSDWMGPPFGCGIPTDVVPKLSKVNSAEICGTNFILANVSNKYLSILDFRKALSKSIDKQSIVSFILNNRSQIANSITPPNLYHAPIAKNSEFNTEEAKKHLITVLEELKTPNNEISISLMFSSGSEKHTKIALSLQQQWQTNLGIVVTLKPVEGKLYLNNRKSGNYDLAVADWIADYSDPLAFLELFKFPSHSPNGSLNNTNWYSETYFDLLEQSNLAQQPEVRENILLEAEKILMEQIPIFTLYHHNFDFLVNDRIKNFATTPLGTIDFSYCTIA